MAKKIQLNSAYGAIGNEHFRFFNLDQATARAGLPGSKEDKGYDSALAALSVIHKG